MDIPSNRELNVARDNLAHLISIRAKESSFQKLFSECPYIFSRALPLKISPIDIVSMGRPGKSEPDFIFYPRSAANAANYGVVEIKRPDSLIATVTRKNILTLSRDAETAISQCQFYIKKMKADFLHYKEGSVILGNQYFSFIIMGLKTQLLSLLTTELMHDQLEDRLPHNCRLIPYDLLLEQFEKSLPAKIYTFVPSFEVHFRILYFDQEETNLNVGSILLQKLGFNVNGVNTLPRFFEEFHMSDYDLILLTSNTYFALLGMDFKDFWYELTNTEKYNRTPILFSSARGPIETALMKNAVCRKDFDEMCRMPFNLHEIQEAIFSILQHRIILEWDRRIKNIKDRNE